MLMVLLMCHKKSSCNKPFLTHMTHVGPLSCMRSHVHYKSWTLCEWFTALVTRVGLFTCVSPLVNTQIVAGYECLTTHITHIWFLPSMRPHMHHQGCLAGNILATYITNKLALTCVRLKMQQHNLLASKTFLTYVTFMFLFRGYKIRVMCFLMQHEPVSIPICQATNVTLVWFLSCVDSFMLLECGLCIESCVANFTLVFVLTEVSLPVIHQICSLNTWITTNITNMVLFPCVDLFMAL